jgi:hypothetical protein
MEEVIIKSHLERSQRSKIESIYRLKQPWEEPKIELIYRFKQHFYIYDQVEVKVIALTYESQLLLLVV